MYIFRQPVSTTIPCGQIRRHMTHTRNTTQNLGLLYATNLRRLMARFDMTLQDLVEATELDERTLRGLLQGTSQPHTRTLHKLAQGLGVSTDELFHYPHLTEQAQFDRATNGMVAEIMDAKPELFFDWAPADFDELFSRVGIGGKLTEEGALSTVHAMNAHRKTMQQVAVVLESDEADLLQGFVEMLFDRVRIKSD